MPRLKSYCRPLIVALAAAPVLAAAQPTPSANDIALINRVSWGATDALLSDVKRQGAEAWLQGQLHPRNGDHVPASVAAQINALPALHKSPVQLAKEANDLFLNAQAEIKAATPPPATASPVQQTAALNTLSPASTGLLIERPQEVRRAYMRDVMRQTQTRHILRDLYSTDQLREQMSWFWFNHFNVYEQKGEVKLFLADYEDRALRPNALGNFRTLLEAVLRSPSMLNYLDNAQNANGKINENYAREIMELHTMGVGSGYSQKDVQELARILTGVSITRPAEAAHPLPRLARGAIRDGMFAFYPARHDYGDKLFLGHIIKGSGYHEVEQALDLLATNPATAQHISKQLAQYFVADSPPAALVNTMAATFSETHGEIAAVLDVMFHSPEFRASLAQPLLKDPQHYVLSAVRMAYDDKPILNTTPIINWLTRLAEPLYGHVTPDGYAMDRSAWNGPGQIEQRFEIAQAIGNGAAGLFKGNEPSATAAPAFPKLQGALYYSGLAETLAPATRTALAQSNSPQEWNILFLASPDFMRR